MAGPDLLVSQKALMQPQEELCPMRRMLRERMRDSEHGTGPNGPIPSSSSPEHLPCTLRPTFAGTDNCIALEPSHIDPHPAHINPHPSTAA